jgi:hypothetical protein
MYTLQYRFRKQNGRLTNWNNAPVMYDRGDELLTIRRARQALAKHIAHFPSFDARLIDRDGNTLGHYKYTQLG